MKKLIHPFPVLAVWLATTTVALVVAGCHTTPPAATPAAAAKSNAADQSGAHLWANNCARCHNFRSPASFSDAEWDIAVHHMRVRANLTAEEHRSIAEFLKSAN